MEVMEFLLDGINKDTQGWMGAWGMRLESQPEAPFSKPCGLMQGSICMEKGCHFQIPMNVQFGLAVAQAGDKFLRHLSLKLSTG